MNLENATTEDIRIAFIAMIEDRDRLAAENKELRGVLGLAGDIINGTETRGGLLYCMDGYYSGVWEDEITKLDEALAKYKEPKDA